MRRRAAYALALTASALLAVSAVTGLRDTLPGLRDTYRASSRLSPHEREQAYGAAVPLQMEIFDFYKRLLRPGDRYYLQVLNGPFSTFADKRTVVTKVGNLYLMPALQVQDPRRADVILSWEQDPADLGLHYSEQLRAGQQLIFASRVRRDG
ncbi:MAG TPA: hypothetical protein VJ689_00380 [Gaiellaceae bacterium]|nr:hypothetical protein [Gaiellaceae bacterium]